MENDFKFENKGRFYAVEVGNKSYKIDAKYIAKQIEVLDIDEEDAIYTWLEDEGIFENEEQNELEAEAKANKPKASADKKVVKKTQKERVVKENPVKEGVIAYLSKVLNEYEGASNIVVENKGKLITFDLNGESFKIDLVQKRKPKNK